MSFWRFFSRFNPFKPSTPTGRELQLRLDTARIFDTLPPSRQHSPSTEPHKFKQQALRVRAHLHHSAVRQLLHLSTALRASNIHDSLQEACGFSLRINESSIPNAGRGVFVQGKAKRGDLVTLYPGVAYSPSELRRLSGVNDYFISRYDGVVIDGAAEVQIQLEGLEELDEKELEHPFAVGHLVNHPQQSVQPNVLQFMLDLDVSKISPKVAQLIPTTNADTKHGMLERLENQAYRQRVPSAAFFVGGAGSVLRTIGLVALRDLENEEVFMDYRFNLGGAQVPQWYHSCDVDSSGRRWQNDGVVF